MKIPHEKLKQLTASIFAAAGCDEAEAARIGHYLTEANLVGHDSHGVIRIPYYIEWLRAGKVLANQQIKIDFENDAIAVVDGQYGFGQSVGEQATKLGIDKCQKQGVAVVALRDAGHLGRIGDWPLLAARAGLVSLHFVNTSGAGILVAPFGGIQRRLSANPIAAGVPVEGQEPILVDMSCCTIAEGKLKVALNKGVQVPENCIIDSKGQPSTDPGVFYGEPGAILSIAGHKGYALGVLTEVLAGSLTGGGSSHPDKASRLGNGMLSIYFDPKAFQQDSAFAADVKRFIDWVKSSQPTQPGGEILMPGEIEQRTRAQRLRDGIDLDDNTWGSITDVAASLGVAVA
ncbi:MAG: malate/lactate/ureidoglycolate dehydrogenase [Planctomycetota bacterium]|nr:MAG: malate/lactate/ureidoglycolate dehydrogenase [Planctomycetota bacterium]